MNMNSELDELPPVRGSQSPSINPSDASTGSFSRHVHIHDRALAALHGPALFSLSGSRGEEDEQ